MDRRKAQIEAKFNDILEEQVILQENLQKIINQVFSSANYVKGSEVKQKDCSVILQYELEVLTKLTELNFDLETLVERSPLNQLKIMEEKYEAASVEDKYECTITEEEKCEGTTKASATELESDVALTQYESSSPCEFDTMACTSAYISELISGNDSCDTQSNFSDSDIQTFRDTLKKYSEKLGLNDECISSMKDFYNKPSTSAVNEIFDSSSAQPATNSNFEVPEKDTNKTASLSDVIENCVDAHFPLQASTHVDDANAYTPALLKTDEANTVAVSSTNSSPILVEEALFVNTDLTTSTSDDCCDTTEIAESKKIVYTALEKFNNATFLNKKDEALGGLVVPDIKLKPTTAQGLPVIKNNFEADNQLRKKNNKKKKSENVFYELKAKAAPGVGADCMFSHVESPSEFYIHVVDDESAVIDILTEQLNEYFVENVTEFTSKDAAANAIRKYCFAYISEYNGWYRAVVLDWQLESKSNDVFLLLVDFGNKRRTSYRNLQRMTNDLTDIPMLAVRCHLPVMYPPESTSLNRLTEWPSQTIDAMMVLSGLVQVEANANKSFKIVYACQEGDSLAVDLYNPQEVDETQTVGQILLDLGLAVQIIDTPDPDNLEVEVFLQDVDLMEKNDNINEAVLGYDPRDEMRICRFTKKDGTCYKGKNCKLEHVPLAKDGFTTDIEPVFKEAMYDLALPQNGEVVNILITGYRDPCNFFAQIVRTSHKEKNYMIDKDLYMLLKDMNVPKTVKTFETFKISPAIGEIVIAKHWSNKWMRAVVRERNLWNNDESVDYQVFLLDFGDYLKVPLSDIRKIKPHFLQLPFQAVECYIHDYMCDKDCVADKAKAFFFDNLYFHNFGAHVIRSTALPLKIGITSFTGMDVGKVLAEKGFAVKRAEDLNPLDDCVLRLS